MAFSGTTGNPKFNDTKDGQLFALMAQRGGEAAEAWEEFYARYVNDLYRFLHRLSDVDIESLVQETMIQAYKSAQTFQADDNLNEPSSRNRTLAWLGRIAQNINFTMYRQQKIRLVRDSEDSASEDENKADESAPTSTGRSRIHPGELNRQIQLAETQVEGTATASDEETESKKMQLLREALEILTERERDILLTTYEYYDRDRVQQRLPQFVIDELCQSYGISPTYLRKIRQRADEKVTEYISSRESGE